MTGSKHKREPRIVAFVCNWGAYSGAEMAGVNRRQYPAGITLTRVACLGRINTGLVLKAFELGADGVVLLGCPPQECHYEAGPEKSAEVVAQSGELLKILGVEPDRLALIEVPVGRDDIMVKELTAFSKRLSVSQTAGRV